MFCFVWFTFLGFDLFFSSLLFCGFVWLGVGVKPFVFVVVVDVLCLLILPVVFVRKS